MGRKGGELKKGRGGEKGKTKGKRRGRRRGEEERAERGISTPVLVCFLHSRLSVVYFRSGN